MIARADTIFAPATAPGRAGLAVMRISGPQTGAVLDALTGGRPAPRRASLRRIKDPARAGEVLDQGLALWFPGPASFTGEDVAELHLHGGRAVVAAVTAALAALPGLRLAEPGEFARRAFLNNRLDLDAAEGLADLIAAETDAQRRQALRQLDGALGKRCEAWRERLIAATARFEASIDFADEELPDDLEAGARREMAAVGAEIAAALADGVKSERLRDGLFVAIVGAPNVGKSSLLNALAGRDAAIVSDRAGTTRDVVEVRLDLGGWPVILADTAGLRDSDCPVEAEGVRRSLRAADQADLVLRVYDAARPETLADAPAAPGRDLLVANKADLAPAAPDAVAVSCRRGDGLAALEAALTAEAEQRLSVGEAGAVTRARHVAILSEAAAHLTRGATAPAAELAAEDARLALRALGRIAGRVDVEDLLDRIFGEFCLGK